MPLRKNQSLLDQASDYVDAAKPAIESAVSTAKDGLVVLAADARDKAVPLLAEKASVAAEMAAQTASSGAARAADLAAVSRDYAAAKVAEAKGEPQKTKGSKVRKVLIFGSLLAIAGFAVNKLKSKSEADN